SRALADGAARSGDGALASRAPGDRHSARGGAAVARARDPAAALDRRLTASVTPRNFVWFTGFQARRLGVGADGRGWARGSSFSGRQAATQNSRQPEPQGRSGRPPRAARPRRLAELGAP